MSKIGVTVDTVLLAYQKQKLTVLLVERKNPPFQSQWALPGGFVEENELLLTAAGRELEEETGIKDVQLLPVKMCDDPSRDPRGHTISMVFWGITLTPELAKAGSDAKHIGWWPLAGLPSLAFDHYQVICDAQIYLQTIYNLARPLLQVTNGMTVTQLQKMLHGFCSRTAEVKKSRSNKKSQN